MILDNFATLIGSVSASGVLTGALATAAGTYKGASTGFNVMDLGPLALGGNQVGDTGSGERLNTEISILQTLTSAGAATVQFQLIQADDAALTTNVQVINQTDAYGYATLTAGTVVPLAWDKAAPYTPKRYVGIAVVVGTAALTNGTGQFFAAVVKDVQDVKNIYYKSGFAVS